MLANYEYYCPHCNSNLSSNKGVSFYIENCKNQRANLYLSPLPCIYHYTSDVEISIDKGEKVLFYCGCCKQSLQSETHPKFVEIHLKVTEDILFEVLFSPICGEKLTYVVMEGCLEKY